LAISRILRTTPNGAPAAAILDWFFAAAISLPRSDLPLVHGYLACFSRFFGYVANVEQPARSMHGLSLHELDSLRSDGGSRALMLLYPLSDTKMVKIEADLKARRGEIEQ